MIQGSIQEEGITIVNIYAPNTGAPQYIRQMLTNIKGGIDSNTILVWDFNTPFTSMDRSSREKINKETQVLNITLDQMNLIDLYREFNLKATEYTFFSSANGTFFRKNHMLGHNVSLGKFKKIEIISSIFSDHNAMRLEVNYKKKEKPAKNTNTWRLKNMLLYNQWITEEIKEEIKKYLETNENKNMTIQNPWDATKAIFRREVYSDTTYLQKQEESQINNLTLHLMQLKKEEQVKPKVSKRKEIIKIRAEINEIEMKKTIEKIN